MTTVTSWVFYAPVSSHLKPVLVTLYHIVFIDREEVYLRLRMYSHPPFASQACFDANTGRYSSYTTLSRASEGSDGCWRAVGLLVTKTHIIVTGSDGSIEWLALPTQPDAELEVW